MTDDKPPPSLEELDARLRKAREGSVVLGDTRPRNEPPLSGLSGVAFRIGAELVAAMIVGVGGGLLLDRWLGTAPWGLVVLFLLGAAAGVMNVYRALAGLDSASGFHRANKNDNGRPDGDGT